MSPSSSFDEVTRSAGMRRTVERHPYVAQGIDGLVVQLGALLKAEKQAQRVVLDVSKPYILLEKLTKGQEDPDAISTRFDAAIRAHVMTEYVPPKPTDSPYSQLFEMFRLCASEGYEVAYVVVGNFGKFSKWVQIPVKNPKVFGVVVQAVKNIPDDVFILCGAEWREAQPEDIEFSVKGVMP